MTGPRLQKGRLAAHSGVLTPPAWEQVVFGEGARFELPRIVVEDSATPTLVMTGPHVRSVGDLVQEVEQELGEHGCGVFDGTVTHTPVSTVFLAADAIRAAGARSVVVVGGSSVMDTARAAALVETNNIRDEEDLLRYALPSEDPDSQKVPPLRGNPIGLYAIPTTLAGSEYTGLAGVTHSSKGVKLLYGHRALYCRAILLDPEATLRTPEVVWRSSGVKILESAAEEICSKGGQPLTNALGLAAIEMMSGALRRGITEPMEQQARMDALHASCLAIFGIHNSWSGIGAALRHPLGARYAITHGFTASILAPHVLAYTREATELRQTAIARAMSGGEITDASVAFRGLVDELGLPTRLRDIGVPREDLPLIARSALDQFIIHYSPVPATFEDLRSLLERAW